MFDMYPSPGELVGEDDKVVWESDNVQLYLV